jgi:hypothetical protein
MRSCGEAGSSWRWSWEHGDTTGRPHTHLSLASARSLSLRPASGSSLLLPRSSRRLSPLAGGSGGAMSSLTVA